MERPSHDDSVTSESEFTTLHPALRLTLFDIPTCEPRPVVMGTDDLAALVRAAVADALEKASAGEKKLFTLAEAAQELTVSPSQLREKVSEGEIPPPVLIAGCKRYTREQLDGIRRTAMIQSGFRNF